MKAFIEYLEKDLAGNLNRPCGDRSIIILDGRVKLENMVEIAIESNGRARPLYPYFQICEGDLKSSRVIYSSHFPKEKK